MDTPRTKKKDLQTLEMNQARHNMDRGQTCLPESQNSRQLMEHHFCGLFISNRRQLLEKASYKQDTDARRSVMNPIVRCDQGQ